MFKSTLLFSLRRPALTRLLSNRAIVYTHTGPPSDVLDVRSFPAPPPPPRQREVNVRFVLAPLNPADINVIQGVYPDRPQPARFLPSQGADAEHVYVAGNEGLAEVTHVGPGVAALSVGDWVVLDKRQAGTWASAMALRAEDVIRVERVGLSAVRAATLMVRSTSCACVRACNIGRVGQPAHGV